MKKTAPIILILLLAHMASAWSIMKQSVYFIDVEPGKTYYTGDTVKIRFAINKAQDFTFSDSTFLYKSGFFRLDTLRFSEALETWEEVNNTQMFVFKIVIPNMGAETKFDPYIENSVNSCMNPLTIGSGSATPVLDETLDKSKEVAYYLDMNGRVVPEPKGLAIVVYTDGSRAKVIFE